jgi:hypothetical protein
MNVIETTLTSRLFLHGVRYAKIGDYHNRAQEIRAWITGHDVGVR